MNVWLFGPVLSGPGAEHWSIPEFDPIKAYKLVFRSKKGAHAQRFLKDNVKVEQKFIDVLRDVNNDKC